MQKNEIQIKLNVEQDDINKKIYFINNIEELDDADNQYIKSSKITNFNACLELKNSNKKINSYNNYFLPEEQGEYIITLTFKEEIQNCNYMFYKCEYVTGLDFSNFCSKNVNNMISMFSYCKRLKDLVLTDFKTGDVHSMEETFSNCEQLEYIDISSFQTGNVKYMNLMFDNCKNLKEIKFPGILNLAKVKNIRGIFYGCTKLENLDLPVLNTDNITNMSRMFFNCINLKSINLQNFNTINVSTMEKMFIIANP